MAPAFLHLRRTLSCAPQDARWPAGIQLKAFDPHADPPTVHALLVAAYQDGGGSVAAYADWWRGLRADPEFDPTLVFVATDMSGQVAGAAQCWTSGFIKDLAVAADWRRKGLGRALLEHAFKVFHARGAAHVDLKVETDNPSRADRLYLAAGMEPVGRLTA